MAKKKTSKKTSKFKKLLYLVALIALAVVLSFGILLFLLGMLPAFVASYVDSSEERNNFRVVAACNFSGVLPFIMQVWKQGITSDSVIDVMLTPSAWMVMYGAAAFGWALVWFFPQAVYFVLDMVQNNSINSLKSKQQQIVDEWGLEVEATSRRTLRNAVYQEEKRAQKAAKS